MQLSFDIESKSVDGVLNGSCKYWTFESISPIFLEIIPTGKLIGPMKISIITGDIRELSVRLLNCLEQNGYNITIYNN